MLKQINNKDGFSLVELIVVVAIVGILVMLGSSNFTNRTKEANMGKHIANVKVLEDSMDRFMLDNDRFPRLSEEAYTSEQIEEYADRIYNITGREIILDPNGKYYDIDYLALKDYVKIPDKNDMPNYILQNPIGRVYYLEGLGDIGKNRVDFTTTNPKNNAENNVYKLDLIEKIEEVELLTPSDYESGWDELTMILNRANKLVISKNSTQKEVEKALTELTNTVKNLITKPEIQKIKEIQKLIDQGYVPIANYEDLNNIIYKTLNIFGKSTDWEKEYVGGLDKKYIQVNDIDMSKVNNFSPIGYNSPNSFRGTYNGGDFTISNLKVDIGSQNFAGLFGHITEASIKNTNLTNVNIKGKHNVGGLVGLSVTSTVSNSSTSGKVFGESDIGGLVGGSLFSGIINNSHSSVNVVGNGAGGLVGGNFRNGEINNCYATGSIDGKAVLGGLVGQNDGGIIKNSYSSGNIKGTSNVIGGLVGQNVSLSGTGGNISDSYATGNIEGAHHIGGLVGLSKGGKITKSHALGEVNGSINVGGLVGNIENNGLIKNSYSLGSVIGDSNVGGLVGYNSYGQISNSYAIGDTWSAVDFAGGLIGIMSGNNSTVTNSYATGYVRGSKTTGGLIGTIYNNGVVKNSYYDKIQTRQSDSGKGLGLSTSEMQQKSNYQDWDFNNTWQVRPKEYPALR